MAKFRGKIGYTVSEEDPNRPGIYVEKVVERTYYGTINRIINNVQPNEKFDKDVHLNMELEILADGFASQNFAFMRYVEYMNSKWEITSAQVRRPRIVITFGGVYNDPGSTASEA